MINGVIFDLDGTLIDSEPLWQEAEISVFNNLGLELTFNDCKKTKGLPTMDAVNYWYKLLECPSKEPELIAQELNLLALGLIKEKAELKDGVLEILDFWASKQLPMGIASASSMTYIKAVVEKYSLNKFFKLIYSGDFEEYGKPHPGIYISTCKKLKIDPVYTIAFEDSFNGVLAAKAARMKAVALLDEGQFNNKKFGMADLKLERLKNFGQEEYEYLNSLF